MSTGTALPFVGLWFHLEIHLHIHAECLIQPSYFCYDLLGSERWTIPTQFSRKWKRCNGKVEGCLRVGSSRSEI